MKREVTKPVQSEKKNNGDIPRYVGVGVFFLLIGYAVYDLCHDMEQLSSPGQKRIYPIVFAFVIAALAALWLVKQLGLMKTEENGDEAYTASYFPVFTGLLALVCMVLCYSFLGVWPVGTKSVMLVDMHHQYAPLLAQMRDTILNGQSLLYSFDLGMGASYLPLIGYYCASPFNLLLLLFPERLLTEAILVITLLKNALIAAFFATALQYIYKRKSYAISAVSVMFSLSMYMIAYSWNIMWLDVIMMLPLVVMGFEQMMREKKFVLYTLSLAYALFVNYYIAFMLCVFMVLYFIVYALREKHGSMEVATGFLRFGGYSVLAASLSALLLVPVALSLGTTSASSGGFAAVWNSNFDFFDLLGRHLYGVEPTIRSGNLPNIYCGVLVLLAVPLFATNKSISGRRRATMLGLLALLAVSFCVNNMDLLWHGLHSPNDLPYRFSFLYSFVLLLITYELLINLDGIQPKSLGASLIGVAAYLVLEEKFGGEAYDFKALYLSFGLILLYALVILMVQQKKLLKDAGMILLLVIVVAEMITCTNKTFLKLNSNEYFTNHGDYVDNDITKALTRAVKTMEDFGDSETDKGFYRVEFLPRRTCADTALYDYNGITIFASSNPYENTRFMGSLGYAVNGVNSYLYRAFCPVADSLMGIRYVAMNSEYQASPQLKQRQLVTCGSSTYTIYENPNALSVGYFVDSAAKSWSYNYYNAYESNNSLMKALTGNPGNAKDGNNVFSCLAVESSGEATSSGQSISFDGTATYNVPVTEAGQLYVYVDCRAAKTISVAATYGSGDSGSSHSWPVTPHEPNMIYAGNVKVGDNISVTLTSESYSSGAIYAMLLNEDVYNRQMQTLHANEMQVEKFTDTKVTGTLSAPREGAVMTSIVYDKGWTVKVDGKKVKTYAIANSMLSFDVSRGQHTITMTFFPTGLLLGIVLFVLGVVAFVFLLLLKKHPEKMNKAKKKLRNLSKKFSSKKDKQPAELITDTLYDLPVAPEPLAPMPPTGAVQAPSAGTVQMPNAGTPIHFQNENGAAPNDRQ